MLVYAITMPGSGYAIRDNYVLLLSGLHPVKEDLQFIGKASMEGPRSLWDQAGTHSGNRIEIILWENYTECLRTRQQGSIGIEYDLSCACGGGQAKTGFRAVGKNLA
jgi:hypothetical protein